MSDVNLSKDFSEILESLQKIARRCNNRDAKAMNDLIKELHGLNTIVQDVQSLRSDLQKYDALLARPLSPSVPDSVDLVFSISALGAVSRFLRMRAPSRAIDLLKAALSQVLEGSRPAMFRGQKDRGRRSESPLIHQVKGILAGLMYVKQASGMQREAAAAWIQPYSTR